MTSTITHQRQSSLPPPYESYPSYDSVSPTSTSQPYLDNPSDMDSANKAMTQLPYYTPLPAFNSPRNYSRRLRTLIESRHKPTFLSLRIPAHRQDLHIVLIDEKSAHSVGVHDQSHLLPSLPCDEENDLQYSSNTRYLDISDNNNNKNNGRRFRRRSSCGQEGEISWCSFSILAVVLFMLVCTCSVFVAWSTGLFAGNGGLVRQMRVVEHTGDGVAVWGGAIGRVEVVKAEGYVLEGEREMEGLTATARYQRADDVREGEEKVSAREEIQRRVRTRRERRVRA